MAALLVVGLGACRGGDDGVAPATGDPASPVRPGPWDSGAARPGPPETARPTRSVAARLCDGAEPVQVGRVGDPALAEVSGLVASARHPGVLWAVADSGQAAEVRALDRRGAVLAVVALPGARNVDWEDLALLRSTAPGAPDRLVIADTGDNRRRRDEVALVVLDEPDLARRPAGSTWSVPSERWPLRWPDGPRDAEALVADVDGRLHLLTKQVFGTSQLARVPDDAGPDGAVALVVEGTARPGLGEGVTAADLSADGTALVVRSYLTVSVYERVPGTPLAEALAGPSCAAPAPDEAQGESLALWPDGSGYVTLSEAGGAGTAPPGGTVLWEVRAGG